MADQLGDHQVAPQGPPGADPLADGHDLGHRDPQRPGPLQVGPLGRGRRVPPARVDQGRQPARPGEPVMPLEVDRERRRRPSRTGPGPSTAPAWRGAGRPTPGSSPSRRGRPAGPATCRSARQDQRVPRTSRVRRLPWPVVMGGSPPTTRAARTDRPRPPTPGRPAGPGTTATGLPAWASIARSVAARRLSAFSSSEPTTTYFRFRSERAWRTCQ